MAGGVYADFHLRFASTQDPDTYTVTATLDGGHSKSSTFSVPMPEAALRAAIRDLAQTRSVLATLAAPLAAASEGQVTRTITAATPEPEPTAGHLGETLADALLRKDVAELYRTASEAGPVRLRLNLTDAPKLMAVPWELLRRNGHDLAVQRGSTVNRELDTDAVTTPFSVGGRIRMLGVIANPMGDLDVAEEQRLVESSLERSADLIDCHWLTNCTYKMLQRALQDPWHILHFVGHGAMTRHGEPIVLLNGEDGGVHEVPGNTIAQLAGQDSLQLVVFNSCDGARTTPEDAFSGLATILVQQGKAAVVAMQFEITDIAARVFAEELYFSLASRRFPVDVAVTEARKAVMGVSPVEFATPVLFLRPGSPDLFAFEDEAPAQPEPTPDPAPAADPARSTRTVAIVGAFGTLCVALIVAGGIWLLGGADQGDPLLSRATGTAVQDCVDGAVFGVAPAGAPSLAEPSEASLSIYRYQTAQLLLKALDTCDVALAELRTDNFEGSALYARVIQQTGDAEDLWAKLTKADDPRFEDPRPAVAAFNATAETRRPDLRAMLDTLCCDDGPA